jgi:hypothetical protein
MLRFITYSLAVLLSIGAASAQTLSAPSVWTNQRGSVLTILLMDAAGNFQGTYVNNAPDTQCRGFPYGAKGSVKGDQVTLIVTFAPCDTVTVWKGRAAGAAINTRFEAAYPNGGHIEIWRGADNFVRQ